MSIAMLLAELRRREVFRAAAWYAGTAAAITQVLDLVADRFGLPPRLMQGVILLGLAGFPLTCVISWFFDFSREGAEVGAPDAATPPGKPWSAPSLWFALVAGALFALGAQQAWRAFMAPAERPGIAVLGFDVLGVETNRALSGGLHEAVLNELAHVSGLRVIARTSVLRFADAKPDIREVGRILDVPFVLEGSVLREGGQLRVHAQLIDAATNEHLWSETYDRPATDIFGVQSALARDIASRLRVTLLPQERARADAAPTAIAAAYDSYLRGAEAFTRYQRDGQGPLGLSALQQAIAALDEALGLDPDFALAHAERSRMLSTLRWSHLQADPTQASIREAALAAATEALRLDPELGEAHRALGLYYYWGLLDYARAERALARARDLLPNDAATTWILGLVRRRQGRGEEALLLFAEAYRLDPANTQARTVYVNTLYYRRQYAAAQRVIEEMLARFPESQEMLAVRRELEFCRTGDAGNLVAAAGAGVGDPNLDARLRWLAAILLGRYADALPIVQAIEGESFGWEPRSLTLARTQTLLGDTAGAAETLRPVIADVEKKIAATPDKLNVRLGLGLAYALSGRPDDARRITEEHLMQTPMERNALDNALAHFEAAEVYATIGDTGNALRHLEATQQSERSVCGNLLRRLPVFASLRADPRFEELARRGDWQ